MIQLSKSKYFLLNMNFLLIKKYIPYLSVFILFFIIFSLIQFSTPNLAGADGYYHIKNAYLLRTQGFINNFPWLQFTIWKDNFSDFHFLFHILLVPFTYGDLIFGAKLATIIFNSLVFLVFYWILKQNKIKFSFFWTILLFCASQIFIFRLNLLKTQSISIIFLFLGFYLIIKKKYFLLFVLSFLYSWTYGASLILLFFIFSFFCLNLFINRKADLKLLIYSGIGLLGGLIINPYFPKNFYYLYIQIFKAGIFHSIPVGMEWFPITDLANFARANLLVLICFAIGITSSVITRSGTTKQSRENTGLPRSPYSGSFAMTKEQADRNDKKVILYSLFIISLFFFVLTLKANRFVEYWVPFTVLFGAFGADSLTRLSLPPSLQSSPMTLKKQTNKKIIKFFTAITLLGLVSANISYASWAIDQGIKYDQYKDAAEWLNKNTPQGSIVFNANWGDFPQLFFYNHHNYYIIGMDPTFMYAADPQKYWLWRHISEEGIICSLPECKVPQKDKPISQVIKEKFKAEYIFIGGKSKYQNLRNILNNDSKFKKTYQNEDTEIWKIKHL